MPQIRLPQTNMNFVGDRTVEIASTVFVETRHRIVIPNRDYGKRNLSAVFNSRTQRVCFDDAWEVTMQDLLDLLYGEEDSIYVYDGDLHIGFFNAEDVYGDGEVTYYAIELPGAEPTAVLSGIEGDFLEGILYELLEYNEDITEQVSNSL